MKENWLPIDLLELIPKKDHPRVIKATNWEINPLGQFRYIDAINMRYKYARPVWIDGEKYFAAIIGSTGGNLVVKKWPVKELIAKYFG